jgi:DNA repair exonuclease SbcCD nuclease subunit
MKQFKFIHTADLHLDTPFKGISTISQSISTKLIDATFYTFDTIIQQCIENQVDFLLVTGDIYNAADRSLRAQLKFREGLKKLSNADINVYVTYGNHDPLDGWAAKLDMPENVHIFSGNTVDKVVVTRHGETIAQIYGISFHTRDIKTNLVHKFPDIQDNSLFTIGMLHCNLGTNTGHEPYAPCKLEDLLDKGYDYWALGHVHNKSIIREGNPMIIYPGNPQGLHSKETGRRGCFLINVDNNQPYAEFIETNYIRWFEKEVSITGMTTEQELITGISSCVENIREEAYGRAAICRIILTGRSKLHSVITQKKGLLEDILQELRDREEYERQFVWVESIVNNTQPDIDRDTLLNREDFIGDLVRLFERYYQDKENITELKRYLEPLFTSINVRGFLDTIDDDTLIELVREAEAMCLDRLFGE